MKRWTTRALGDLCDVEGGNAAPQGGQHFQDGRIPFVRMKDLGREHFTNNLVETADMLTDASVSIGRMKMFEPGCILFPRSGSVALNHRAILGVRACVVSHIGVLRNLHPELLVGYLYYYLTTFDMTALSKKTTGVDSIAFTDVKKIPVPVPPLQDQARIVKLLNEADTVRRLRAQQIEGTNRLVAALFYDMFGDLNPATTTWPVKHLGSMAKIVTGNTPSRSRPDFFGDYVDWIKTDNIDAIRGRVRSSAEGLSEEGAKVGRLVPSGSVLITCIAGTRDRIGDAAVTHQQVALNQQINALVPNDGVDPAYLCQLVMASKREIQQRATGVMTGIINKSTLASILAICPPSKLQREFGRRAEAVRAIQAEQSSSSDAIDRLFASMLHRAFRGEL